MEKLQALIAEALEKFPSEDIRELVAKETGLTVEEVSEKMNEAAKASSGEFPAPDFTLIAVKSDTVTPKHDVGDVDGDGESNTDADKEIVAGKVKDATDTDGDNKISYKIGYLPKPTSDEGDHFSHFADFDVSDVPFESKTGKIGMTVADALDGYSYDYAYAPYSKYVYGTYEYTTESVNLEGASKISDISNIGEISYPNETFVADGTVIFLFKK